MKRKIALLIIAVVMMSLSSCESMSKDNDLPATLDSAENENSQDVENNADTEKENTVKGDDAEETETKQETPDNSSDEQETEPEKNDDTESEPSADVSTTEPNEVTEPQTEPYLPVKLGYVDVFDNNGQKQYITQKYSFTVEYPVTEEIAMQALIARNKDYILTNYECNSYMEFGMYKNLEELERAMAKQNCMIVKGVFLPEHGTSIVEYEKRGRNIDVNMNYYVYDYYTRYNFKIEKIYTKYKKFDVGDVIPVILDGAIIQQPNGTYLAEGENVKIKYRNFSKRSLEERTFVLALDNYNYSKRGGYTNIYIFLNAYEYVQDKTGDKDKQIAYDILQKYN